MLDNELTGARGLCVPAERQLYHGENTENGVVACRLRVLMNSDVEEIFPNEVRLRQPDGTIDLHNDALILESLGIEVQTKHGTR